MKIIGLLGGVTWHSTQQYYQYINKLVDQQLGKGHSAEMILYSFDFQQIRSLQESRQYSTLSLLLQEKALSLQELGAQLLIIGANTLHMYFRDIVNAVDMEVLHIADAVGNELRKLNISCAGLLGTKYTMERDFYKQRLIDIHGIETVVPDPREQEVINRIIFDELANGNIREASKEAILRITDRLIAGRAEAIIMGCTEIPLLISQQDRNYPLLDTTFLHAEYTVNRSLTE